MTRPLCFIFTAILSMVNLNLFSQFTMAFGNITTEELSNNPYLPDPGADAIILSDIGIARLNYVDGFTIELERDVRIRIVNSNGFDYADIEIPFSASDNLFKYRASSFNLRNGEKVETVIPKKSFILEESTKYRKVLKFNFPDVQEGTVIEYSYIVELKDESIYTLVPWAFQTALPVVYSSLIAAYPDLFSYKSIISGDPAIVRSDMTSKYQIFGGYSTNVRTYTWTARNVPAYKDEPFAKSLRDNQTRLSFELASVNFPRSPIEEISPTYNTLTRKLLDREDFGAVLNNATFLEETALKITEGLNDDLSKVKAIHKYLTEKILWNGEEDYTASSTFRKVLSKKKGNNADINMMLIGMLRCLKIKADPVILCTRSNGTINEYSAMLQQFNYLVANVTAGGKSYLVDATNPLRSFNMLPFDCLNGVGRQISNVESKFVDLKNSESISNSLTLNLALSADGMVEGDFSRRSKGYPALEIREKVRLEGEDGYKEIFKYENSEADISGYILNNLSLCDSDITETCKIQIEDGVVYAGDKVLINPYFLFKNVQNPFTSPERRFPVDFGCQVEDIFSLSLEISDKYSIEEMPENVTYTIGEDDARYIFTCSGQGNMLVVKSTLRFNRTTFMPADYARLRDFFAKMLQSQARLVVLKKKI
jgi:hypothetical protein